MARRRTVKVNYTLLGTPLSARRQMVNVDGRWYGKDTIEKIKEHQQEATAKTDAAATAGSGRARQELTGPRVPAAARQAG